MKTLCATTLWHALSEHGIIISFLMKKYARKKANYQKNYHKGLRAEKIVMIWLRLKGWRIVQHNYQSPLGQIDIIAQKKQCLAAIEVKRRNNLKEDPVSFKQKQRLYRSFSYYIAKNKGDVKNKEDIAEYSIDLIIYKPPFSFRHIKGFLDMENFI